MRIRITERCSGHGRCFTLASEVYQGDEEGYNAGIGRTIDVRHNLIDAARKGVASCPEQALEIIEE